MDSHLNRNLPPIQRGSGTYDRMEGQADGRSVFASRVMATEGPSPLGPLWTGSPKDGCPENDRTNKPTARDISLLWNLSELYV